VYALFVNTSVKNGPNDKKKKTIYQSTGKKFFIMNLSRTMGIYTKNGNSKNLCPE